MIPTILLFFLMSHSGFSSPECTCVPSYDSTGRKIVKDYHSIFKGTVSKIDSIKYVLRLQTSSKDSFIVNGFLVSLNVERVWRGMIEKKVVKIITGDGSGDCGYPFRINSQYIVFAELDEFQLVDSFLNDKTFLSRQELIYTTNICDETTYEIERMEFILDSLGRNASKL